MQIANPPPRQTAVDAGDQKSSLRDMLGECPVSWVPTKTKAFTSLTYQTCAGVNTFTGAYAFGKNKSTPACLCGLSKFKLPLDSVFLTTAGVEKQLCGKHFMKKFKLTALNFCLFIVVV